MDIDASQEVFQSHILDLFPHLKDAGGYRFLKGNVIFLIIFQFTLIFYTRNLEPLSLYVHKSCRHLKERAAKRTYIRPLQKDLDLTPLEDEFVVCLCLFMYCQLVM